MSWESLIRREVLNVAAVAVSLLAVILITTDRAVDDWQFGANMLCAYVAMTVGVVAWRYRRQRRQD